MGFKTIVAKFYLIDYIDIQHVINRIFCNLRYFLQVIFKTNAPIIVIPRSDTLSPLFPSTRGPDFSLRRHAQYSIPQSPPRLHLPIHSQPLLLPIQSNSPQPHKKLTPTTALHSTRRSSSTCATSSSSVPCSRV